MRLAKLTVHGFKSFADRTEFTFDDPVTGVVGPNGCGKSNIVDAVKWVLGERSAKSLRGKEMADVIFAGSAGRAPAGVSSVVLTFDNPLLDDAQLAALEREADLISLDQESAAETADTPDTDEEPAHTPRERHRVNRLLPIDTETVDIERRLYRDGTSQYLINGRRARLKDIKDLFLDTGVGAHAYSIIEQGKVDAMLLANAVERRVFFEEAAGVAKFKARRIEAQRRLERAENNLIRAREQLDSTERRLRIVRGQATKARRFKELDAEFRGVRMALAFEQYDDLTDRLDGLTSRLQDVERERNEALDIVASLESDKQEAEVRRHELSGERQQAERDKTSAEHRAQTAQQRMEMTQRAIAESQRQIASDRQRRTVVGNQIESLQQEAEEKARQVESLDEALRAAEDRLEQAAAARADAQTTLADARRDLASRRAAVANIDRERATLEARLESETQRANTLDEDAARLESRRRTLADESAQLRADIARAEQRLTDASQRVESTEAELNTLLQQASTLGDQQRQLTERLNESERHAARLDSRRSTLQEMIQDRVGLDEAVKAVLDLRDQAIGAGETEGLLPHIESTLADRIETDAEHAAAVEAALGAALQGLIIPGLSNLSDESVLASLPGRVTLLAKHATEVDHHTEPLEDRLARLAIHPATATPLASVVRCESDIRPLVDRLLSRTLLVPTVESALMLGAGPLPGVRFVTRSGTVIEPDARILAGPASAGDTGGILQRASELHTLEAALQNQRTLIERDRQTLRTLDERARDLNESLSNLRSALADAQRLVVGEENTRDRLRADLDRIERELPRAESELKNLRDRAAAARQERDNLRERIDRLSRLHAEEAEQVQTLEKTTEETAQTVESTTDRVTTSRIETGRISEQLSTARRDLNRAETAAEEAEREYSRLAEHVTQRENEIAAHEETIGACRNEIDEAHRVTRELTESLASIESDLNDIVTRSHAISERLNGARRQAELLNRDFNSLEVTKRELEVRREALEERTLEEIDLDLADELDEYRAMMADGTVARIDIDAVSKEAEQLRDDIRRLGNVNLDAIDEEANLEGRNEELARQVADIDNACSQLQDLIVRLSDASRDRFREMFELIQEQFSGQDGMFRRLFGGGRAEVRLVPHPETNEIDWLESGIEIIAKPPGKQPRTISQLSGGEKTMTAVALLMSIFQAKPSPFCILDEVDAALDDANVERFCTIIRQFLDQCHFIVITHNKRTMQVADRLYGVTMQERGVSKRVSVRFDQVGSNGEIPHNATQHPEIAPIDEVTQHDERPRNGSLREQLAAMRREQQPLEVHNN